MLLLNIFINKVSVAKAICRLFIAMLFFSVSSCKKYLDIDPPTTQLTTTTVFASDQNALAAIIGIYSRMMESGINLSGGNQSINVVAGLSGDEFDNYSFSSESNEFYLNSLTSSNSYNSAIWNEAFNYIYGANAVLEGLDHSTNVTNAVKAQLQGEAKFIRAFFNFYLTNLFGGIPLASSTDYRVNNVLERADSSSVYNQIISDLIDARSLMNATYETTDRSRPNKAVATALLARVYLYTKQWEEAEIEASLLIDDPSYSLASLSNVFTKNSTEAIWQLQPVVQGYNTFDASVFILTYGTNPFQNTLALREDLVDEFESGDNRKDNWVGIYSGNSIQYYPYKYKIGYSSLTTSPTEYLAVFRLVEQYLIRSEARIQQGNISNGIADLNVVRTRARALPTIAIPDPLPALDLNLSEEDAMNAVVHERQIELFSEWGHRWFDLKRLDLANQILAPKKGSAWQKEDALYPIPLSEINNNPKLTQNPNY